MYSSLQRGIITLIKSAVNDIKYDLPSDFVLSDAVEIIKEHEIEGLVYYGAIKSGFDPSVSAMKSMFSDLCNYMALDQRQLYETSNVIDLFEKNHIDYAFLKGIALKPLYPKSDMRVMGDVDILIKPEQYETIKKCMLDLKYSECVESDHELTWIKSGIMIELHKRVIPSYNKDFYSYFGDDWKLFKRVNNESSKYEMSADDNFIYLFAHFSKHYRDGGIGLRQLIDIWIYKNKNSLNEKYLLEKFKILNLDKFYNNICSVISSLFEDKPLNDKDEYIVEYIFSSGVFGTSVSHSISSNLRYNNLSFSEKFKRIFFIVFLPLRYMKKKYPVLNSVPFLLPLMWVYRWFEILLINTKKISSFIKINKGISNNKISDYKKSLEYVGLNSDL